MTIKAEFMAKITLDFDEDIINMETVSGQEQILKKFITSYCANVEKIKNSTEITTFEIDLDSLTLQ